MSADLYYQREIDRHPTLNEIYPTRAEIRAALKRWTRANMPHGAKPFDVLFRPADDGNAWCSETEIVFPARPSWLLVAHEFAHAVQWRIGFKPRRWHGPFHVDLVDTLCAEVAGEL